MRIDNRSDRSSENEKSQENKSTLWNGRNLTLALGATALALTVAYAYRDSISSSLWQPSPSRPPLPNNLQQTPVLSSQPGAVQNTDQPPSSDASDSIPKELQTDTSQTSLNGTSLERNISTSPSPIPDPIDYLIDRFGLKNIKILPLSDQSNILLQKTDSYRSHQMAPIIERYQDSLELCMRYVQGVQNNCLSAENLTGIEIFNGPGCEGTVGAAERLCNQTQEHEKMLCNALAEFPLNEGKISVFGQPTPLHAALAETRHNDFKEMCHQMGYRDPSVSKEEIHAFQNKAAASKTRNSRSFSERTLERINELFGNYARLNCNPFALASTKHKNPMCLARVEA